MLLIGYCLGVLSELRLFEKVKLNRAYRWFCRRRATDPAPDHSIFSNRRRGHFRESETLRYVFEQVHERCIAAGLVQG